MSSSIGRTDGGSSDSLCYLGRSRENSLIRKAEKDEDINKKLRRHDIIQCDDANDLNKIIEKVISNGRYFYIGGTDHPDTTYIRDTTPESKAWKRKFEKKKTYYSFVNGTGVTERKLIETYRTDDKGKFLCVNKRTGGNYRVVYVLIGQKRPSSDSPLPYMKYCPANELSAKVDGAISKGRYLYIGYTESDLRIETPELGNKDWKDKYRTEEGYFGFVCQTGTMKKELVDKYKKSNLCVNKTSNRPKSERTVYVLVGQKIKPIRLPDLTELEQKIQDALTENRPFFIGRRKDKSSARGAKTYKPDELFVLYNFYYACIDESDVTKKDLVNEYMGRGRCLNKNNEKKGESTGYVFVLVGQTWSSPQQ